MITPDGLYEIFPDCANRLSDGATVAIWLESGDLHPNYTADNPLTAEFLAGNYDRFQTEQPAIALVFPDWDLFYSQLEGSPVELAIAGSSNRLAFMKLGVEFGKRSINALDVSNLKKYWNETVATVSLTKAQIKLLNQWIAEANLPIQIAANQQMIDRGVNG